jgi:secondary thiamine-phosphate synthase enzyme
MVTGTTITVSTRGFSDVENITDPVRSVVRKAGVREGIVNVFAVGSTASVTTIEFEPALVADMQEALERLWSQSMQTRHSQTWGDDNGFSHLRASFLGPAVTVPIHEGDVLLGTWQQIVVIDHDNRPRQRKVHIQVMGE